LKRIILGTAGHIDHGKTSLVRAATGINTDRLKEEQKRGITIELGFAHVTLPSGQILSVVDVPGHEKFVKNMVAGSTGIDIVTMVIAADEGVMPQTREHMEICSLLGIQKGLVALTKTDLADPEWMELVIEDIRAFSQGTFLEGAPVVPVSSVKKKGIGNFLKTLDTLCKDVRPRSSAGPFRLPIDRVFTMKGFGAVVTGTLISGQVRVGDPVMLYPSGVKSKVRGIQAQNQSVESAEAGMRTAVNFQGLKKSAINRGETLSSPGALVNSHMLDVMLEYLSANRKPLKNRTLIRFHAGTREVMGRVILLDKDELAPGEKTAAQLRLESPVALVKDDRFVIRSYSPAKTVGGGVILNPAASKHKRFKPGLAESIEALSRKEPGEIAAHHSEMSGNNGVSFDELKVMTNLTEKPLSKILSSLMSENVLALSDRENRVYVHAGTLESLQNKIRRHLSRYHEQNPLKTGPAREELKTQFPGAHGKLVHMAVNRLEKRGDIVSEEETVRLSGHHILLGTDQKALRKDILDAYKTSGLTPPYFKDLCQKLEVDRAMAADVLRLLIDEGLIVKIKEDLYFHHEPFDRFKEKLIDFLSSRPEISTPEIKELAGVSRKYLIPLIEYLDSKNVTIRVGDARRLRNPPKSS
jgi:selenocysteine-specific elongation factor